MVTCIQQGDLFYSSGLHRNHVLATANTGEIRRHFRKNASEWTGRVEISQEEIPGSKCIMHQKIWYKFLGSEPLVQPRPEDNNHNFSNVKGTLGTYKN